MTDQNCVHLHIQNFVILIAAFFSLLSRFSFALLMHPAYAVDIKISKKSMNLLMLLKLLDQNPVLQWEITGSITLYMVWARQGILRIIRRITLKRCLKTYYLHLLPPKISYAAVS